MVNFDGMRIERRGLRGVKLKGVCGCRRRWNGPWRRGEALVALWEPIEVVEGTVTEYMRK